MKSKEQQKNKNKIITTVIKEICVFKSHKYACTSLYTIKCMYEKQNKTKTFGKLLLQYLFNF